MSRFKLPLSRVRQLNNCQEIIEARKRVIYKRFLAKNEIPFDINAPTQQLKTLYFAIAKKEVVQHWPEDFRKYFRRWGETEILKILREEKEAEDRRKAWEAEREAERQKAMAYVFGGTLSETVLGSVPQLSIRVKLTGPVVIVGNRPYKRR